MVGPDTSLTGGLLAAAVLLVMNALLVRARLRWPRLRKTLQGSSTVLVLHGQPCDLGTLRSRLAGETTTGLLLGLACGTIVAAVCLVWLGQPRVALCLLLGISLGVTASAAFGLSMPLVLRMSGRDPQVASGPIALVAADMITLSIYFSAAQWLLS